MAVFRVERTKDFTIMSNHHLRNRNLSLKAKGLHSLMLSLPEGWDYTQAGLAHICRDGLSSIRATVAELEEHGYLKRHRLRNDKGQLTETEYTILEHPVRPQIASGSQSDPICENRTQASQPICDFPILDSPMLDFPAEEKPMEENRMQLIYSGNQNIQKSNMNKSIIHPINPMPSALCYHDEPMDRIDMTDEARAYRALIKSNIEYDILAERYGSERMDEAVELILEAVLSRRERIRVAGDEYPREIVRSRLLKITPSHIEYAFDSIDRNTTKVHNIKAYLLTTLYNAPATMDSYYRTEVNYDLYGGGE